jgi:hypothetical protein
MDGKQRNRPTREAMGVLRRTSARCGERTYFNQSEGENTMKKFLATIMSVAVVAAFTPMASAQSACPPEVAKAKSMLSQKSTTQAPRTLAGARTSDPQAGRGQDVQAPRSLAGARTSDPQAARGQNPQAARGENPQAARGENPQAARGQDVQTARGASAAKPSGDVSKASGLIKEAEAACKAGDVKTAKEKADAAISILK